MSISTLQKEQMESLYNLYKRQYYLCENKRERALGGMEALRHIAKNFGYSFEAEGIETINEITCTVYKLEEI